MPGDTIKVEADISDNDVLPSVTFKLLDAVYTPVDHQESFAINATSYHLSFSYLIENNYLASGSYFVTLSTTDGVNYKNEYRTIQINEIPRTLKAVYVLTQPDSNHVSINKLDSTNQFVHQFDLSGDYSSSTINSRYSELDVAGKTYGAFNQVDLNSNLVLFSIPAYNLTLPSFRNLFLRNNLAFISYFDGNIKAFDNGGQQQFHSEQPVYYQPGAICANDKYVFAEAYYQSPDEHRLAVIFYPSGVARQEYNIGIDVASILSIDDNNVIIFGNKSGNGKIYLYDVVSNGANDFQTLFGNVIYSAVAIDNDRYAIATSNGLYSYQKSINNLIPIDVSESIYSLEYNDLNGVLFCSTGRKIKEYDFPQSGVLNSILSTDSILNVRIQFSK